jgi:hypothetical protein
VELVRGVDLYPAEDIVIVDPEAVGRGGKPNKSEREKKDEEVVFFLDLNHDIG